MAAACRANGGINQRDLIRILSKDSELSRQIDKNMGEISLLIKDGVDIADVIGYGTLLFLDEPLAVELGQFLSPSPLDEYSYGHLQFARMALTNIKYPVRVAGCFRESSKEPMCSASLYFLNNEPEISKIGQVEAKFPVYAGCNSEFLADPVELLVGEIEDIGKYLPGLERAVEEKERSLIYRVPASRVGCSRLFECGFFGELAGTLIERPENKIYRVNPLKVALLVSRNRLSSGYGEVKMERLEEVALDKARLSLEVLRRAIGEAYQRNLDDSRAYV